MVKPTHGKHSEYYEAILQLRDVSDEVVAVVDDEIDKKEIFVAKIKKVTNGYDYYLGNGNLTRVLGKTLQEKFGGEYAVTATLFTRKEGKPVYRLTVLFRAMPFKKGDEVEYQGENYAVLMSGKKLRLQHLKTGKKIQVWHKDMKQIRAKD